MIGMSQTGIILKTIGNRKGDCAWSCSRGQTQPEKICKSQRTNQCHSLRTFYWFVLCNLQIFSGCVCPLEQLHAQSPFLFPIVFSINLIPFFDISSVLAVPSPRLFGYVLLYFTWATARSQELLFVVLACHALRALDSRCRLRTRRRVCICIGSTRCRGNHMHDHSRFQRDIDDVTGVSLSLLLTKVTHAQYRKRFRASYNEEYKSASKPEVTHRSLSDLIHRALNSKLPSKKKNWRKRKKTSSMEANRTEETKMCIKWAATVSSGYE